MATVYLANDLKHDRKVAIKVLKPELAAVIGADRFLVEIKTTAQLQHPHILPLFDSGNADSILYYVMPYVEGETLRARLDRETQLPIEDAIRLTREVADALDYAHRHGVIHRDIKPENILLHDGRPVVADFGIALALSAAAGGRMTETGMSLGTPHYMSPEQATADKEITGRSDIYSLGSVLYEMISGEPPHLGNSAQQIIMKIIAEEAPRVTKYRKSVPEHVAAAVAKAIEKLPADRFATAKEFADALGDPSFHGTGAGPHGTVALRSGRGPSFAGRGAWIAGGLALLLGGVAAWGWLRTPPAQPVVRYRMTFDPGQAPREGVTGINVAISPDGEWMAYVGPAEGGLLQLWLRRRDRLEATPISGTMGAVNPFFSPDGKRLGFQLGATFALTVVAVDGGPAITLDPGAAGSGGGATWGYDGFIYFDSPFGTKRIPADGGTAELVIPVDTVAREVGFAWTEALPNGRGLIFRSRRNLDPTDFDLNAFDLKTHTRHVLGKGLFARYIAPGYLMILRTDGALLVAPFDQDKLAFTGPLVPLIAGVQVKPLGSADLAVSRSGTLAYASGTGSGSSAFAELVTVDRSERVTPFTPPITISPSSNRSLSLSPDGKKVAFDVLGAVSPDIWIKNLPGGPTSRLTFDSLGAVRPRWSADGKYIYYVSGSGRDNVVRRRRADGSAPAELVWADTRVTIYTFDLSRDGQWLFYRASGGPGVRDIFAVHLGHDTLATAIINGPAMEDAPALSPDGRWLAYTSDETGREEVYVRPFPKVDDGRWQISTEGGGAPRWARSGHELFFVGPIGDMWVTTVPPGQYFERQEPRLLFANTMGLLASISVPYYDLTPGDRDFIAARPTVSAQSAGSGQLIVVDHWTTELLTRMQAH